MTQLEQNRRAEPATDAEVTARLLGIVRPAPDAAREAALLERIMAAAERTPRLAVVSSAVSSPTPTATAAVAPQRRPAPRRDLWAAAGVLAASLIVGFVAGQMSLPHATVHQVAEATGVSLSSDTTDAAALLALAERGEDD